MKQKTLYEEQCMDLLNKHCMLKCRDMATCR